MALIAPTSKLFKRLLKGDESALCQLLSLHFETTFHFVLSWTKSRTVSREIVEEAFHRIWENRVDYSRSDSFESSLAAIIDGLVVDYLEKAAKDDEVANELWRSIQKLTALHDREAILDKRSEFISASIHNNRLQLELLTANLSTSEG